MATSPETMNQVRNILRKLDRSIDEARSKRLMANGQPGPESNPDEPNDVKPGRARPLVNRPEGFRSPFQLNTTPAPENH
ncbi:MAG: hypothetical protein KDA20_12495 [Phycisphaerales bacterium]|nr:hypothetical protein [Phycisphaerales bacterium]